MIKYTLRRIRGDVRAPVGSQFRSYPRLVIEVEGIDDVYRIARALEGHQVEFSEIARGTLKGLDLVAKMGPHDPWRYQGSRPRR